MTRPLLLACFLCATPVAAQDHANVVVSVKASLEAMGVDLHGSCGAFAIVKRVAWRLRAEGAGLLDKPQGNNCDGFSVDYLVFRDGRGVDILGDAGGANVPSWGESVDPSLIGRWRAPIDPGDSAPMPTPPVVILPPLPSIDLSPILQRLDVIQADVTSLKAQVTEFREAVGSWRKATLKFLAERVAPIVAAWLATWQVMR